MNQRSKRAWIENVAWTLVVSMSVLQLTSGWQWKAAQAGDSGGKPCWTTANTDPLFERCAGCADAACPGTWIDLISYEYCLPADQGFFDCRPQGRVHVGFEGDCVESYSYLAIAICVAAGAGAGARSALPGCLARCAPAIPTGKGYLLCMAGCLGVAGAVGGGLGWTACCSQGCFCISSCNQVMTNKKMVTRPGVLLQFPGCPGS